MNDFSKQNQFELATAKLKGFSSLLEELIHDKSKRKAVIESNKNRYIDSSVFGWSAFSSFLMEKCLSAQNIPVLVHYLEDLKKLADGCIGKYSYLMKIKKEIVINVFADFPQRVPGINYSRLSFFPSIEFCVKTTLFVEQNLPLLAQNMSSDEQTLGKDSQGSNNANKYSDESIDRIDHSFQKQKGNPEVIIPVVPEKIFRTDEELAEYLRCSTVHIWKLKRQDKLPFKRDGKIYTYKQSAIDEAVNKGILFIRKRKKNKK